MMVVVVLYEVNAKFVESKDHPRMLHDPDRVFVGNDIPANKLSIIPFSTSVSKKKDSDTDAVQITFTVIGPNFQKNMKLWVNSFKESGIEDLSTDPPTYKAVSPFWFLRGMELSPVEDHRDVRLIMSTVVLDCSFSVTAKGILNTLGNRVTATIKVPIYTNAIDLQAGDHLFPPVGL